MGAWGVYPLENDSALDYMGNCMSFNKENVEWLLSNDWDEYLIVLGISVVALCVNREKALKLFINFYDMDFKFESISSDVRECIPFAKLQVDKLIQGGAVTWIGDAQIDRMQLYYDLKNILES